MKKLLIIIASLAFIGTIAFAVSYKNNTYQKLADENLLASEYVQTLYAGEINGLINSKNGFKMFERINKFVLITKPFEVGVELSAKQEIMRFRIGEIYAKEITSLFAQDPKTDM